MTQVDAANPLKVGIVGGTGYTGVELLRLLVRHPLVRLETITSRSEQGLKVSDLYPTLRGYTDLKFEEPDVAALAACDVVFFATPHNVAMRLVPELLAAGTRVVDLSADFRLRDAGVWSQWYGEPHACPELLDQAVYGLPEVNRERIRGARLVACAGCYPTSIQLGYLPLLERGWVRPEQLIASAASGASGAGRGAKVPMLLAEASESFKAYGAGGHRHLPEIEQGLGDIAGGPVSVTFVPHLVPMVRRYADEPFVDVMPQGSHPETRFVKGSNHCRLAIHRPGDGDVLVVLSVIDNLVKGASGQAIQCMNLMFGLEETAGIDLPALLP